MSSEAVDTIKTTAKTTSTNHLSAGDIWWRFIDRQIRTDMRPKPPKLIHANEKRRIAAVVMAGLSGFLLVSIGRDHWRREGTALLMVDEYPLR
jgi:hypothetical protein